MINNPSAPSFRRTKVSLLFSSFEEELFDVQLIQERNQTAETYISLNKYKEALGEAQEAEIQAKNGAKKAGQALDHFKNQIVHSLKHQAVALTQLSLIDLRCSEYKSAIEKSLESEKKIHEAYQYDPDNCDINSFKISACCEIAYECNHQQSVLPTQGRKEGEATALINLAIQQARMGLKSPFARGHARSFLECQLVHAVCLKRKFLCFQ